MFGLSKKRIYLDHASATPVLPEAIAAMREAEKLVGNPGAIHAEAVEAKKALEEARSAVASELACKSREVIFTSGLTESNNLAILGVARKIMLSDFTSRSDLGVQGPTLKRPLSGTHWIVSAIEHDAVLDSFAEIERLGGEVTHVLPDVRGQINASAVEKVLQPETVMVSVGWANNETGVVQPLREIARMMREKNPDTLFHSDAGQAPLYIAPHVHTVDVDLLALGSNKLYGPHGIGALYISNRVQSKNIFHGGKQERGLRPGTENVALAAGFAAAIKEIGFERNDAREAIRKFRDQFARDLEKEITQLVFNGDLDTVLPHMLNISVYGVDAEYVTLALSEKGVSISTKSACREGEESRSHVVEAMFGKNPEQAWRAECSFRISLGRNSTQKELMKATKLLTECVNLSRAQENV